MLDNTSGDGATGGQLGLECIQPLLQLEDRQLQTLDGRLETIGSIIHDAPLKDARCVSCQCHFWGASTPDALVE